jgi:hypothetical protein
MTDKDLGEFIAVLQRHSALGRVTFDEIAAAIRFAETQGYQVRKAAT